MKIYKTIKKTIKVKNKVDLESRTRIMQHEISIDLLKMRKELWTN